MWACVVCALVLWASGASSARASDATGSRVLVGFAADATAEMRDAAVRAVDGMIDTQLAKIGVTRVVAGSGYDAPTAAGILARQPGVANAQADGSVRLQLIPNDALYLS